MKNIIEVSKKYALKMLLCAGLVFGFAYGANADANTNATHFTTADSRVHVQIVWLDGHKYVFASTTSYRGGVFVMHAFSCPCLNNSNK